MPLVALHTAAARQDTGVVVLARADGTWRLRLDLVRGWVHGFAVERTAYEEPARRPSEHAANQAKLVSEVAPSAPIGPPATRLAQLLATAVRARFDARASGPQRSPWDATTPFHPLAALRVVVGKLLDPVDARATMELALAPDTRLRIEHPLHTSALDPDEQIAAGLLSTTRSWSELLARSRVTPSRLLRLLRDAAAIGALRIGDAEQSRAMLHLMIHGEAEEAARHAKYRAEARDLHPDLHPEADSAEKQRLNAAMADLAARNRR